MKPHPFIAKAFLAASLACVSMASAQTETVVTAPLPAKDTVVFGWKRQFNGLLNFNQAYQDNWTKGGSDALAWELSLTGSAVLEQKDFTWESNLKILYGRTKLADLGSRKSSDEWDLETIYTRKLGTWVNPFVSATGQSQFAPGYIYVDAPPVSTRTQVSDFFDPAYFTQTLGLGITPVEDLTERIGATMKQTLSSTAYKFADDVDTKNEIEAFKQEYGLSSTTEYKFDLMQNIQASTRLDVFINFKSVDEIDGHWQNQVTAKVNKFVNANFALEYLYDKDLSRDTQMREALSVGIFLLSL